MKLLKSEFAARWPNFTVGELSCSHCGEYYHWPEFLDRLQALRDKAGPLHLTSAHRCRLHNASRKVRGAPFSEHLRMAVDISLHNHDRFALLAEAKRQGFTGFGLYIGFLHIDMGDPRAWPGSKKAKAIWQNY